MPSLPLFTDILELHLLCGAHQATFAIHDGAVHRTSARRRDALQLQAFWDGERSLALMADLEERLLSTMPRTPATHGHAARRSFEVGGHALDFEILTCLGLGMSNEASFRLLGANPWPGGAARLDEQSIDIALWASEREARRRALRDAGVTEAALGSTPQSPLDPARL